MNINELLEFIYKIEKENCEIRKDFVRVRSLIAGIGVVFNDNEEKDK